jgi:hypothetical protein
VVTVALLSMAPHAVADLFTAFLFAIAVVLLLFSKLGSLTLMLGAAGATMFARMILALPCGAFASSSSADLDAANQN